MQKLCECGCEGIVKTSKRRFVPGHAAIGLKHKGEYRNCEECKKELWIFASRIRAAKKRGKDRFFCNRQCTGIYLSRIYKGSNGPSWRGGKILRDGRPMITVPEHPRSSKEGYVYEHLIIAEKALGRSLKYYGYPGHPDNEVVHHIDGNKKNNDNSNLLICTNTYHKSLHGRIRRQAKRKLHDRRNNP